MSGSTSAANILTVGAGEEYSTIAAAIAASQNGDTIDVNAGTYTNDFATITTQITLQAVGGVVNMVATEPPSNDKGILTVDASATIQGFAFSGAAIPADLGNNGAGIRYENGDLTLLNDDFTDNQDGLLATPWTAGTGTIDIENSEFADNGAGDGFSHNIYVGDVANFIFNDSYSHDAIVGHDIKSRAENTTITNSRIMDGTSTASYTIDLPNGGNAVIENDVIQQGANSQNPDVIAYGEEGNLQAGSALTISDDTIVNDLTSSTPVGIWNASTVSASISNDQVYGLTSAELLSGPGSVSGITYTAAQPALSTTSDWQPTTTPEATTIGSGSSEIVLDMSEDAWKGNAQFTVSVDGVQVGGVQTVTASHAAGQVQEFDLMGDWSSGQQNVSVDFLNDAYGGSASEDRNLYLDSASYQEVVSPTTLTLMSSGAQSLSVGSLTAPITLGSGPDTLDLKISEDAWNGNAQFTISIDGTQIGGVLTAAALQSAGQTQDVIIEGNFGSGSHTASVQFLNDAYGGSPSTDRNLYIDGATIDGTTISGSTKALMATGSKSFTFEAGTTASPLAAAVNAPAMAFISPPTSAGTSATQTEASQTLASTVLAAGSSGTDLTASTALLDFAPDVALPSGTLDPTPSGYGAGFAAIDPVTHADAAAMTDPTHHSA